MSGSKKQIEGSRGERGVLCAKCEHLNPAGLNTCEFCRAHLHVVCSFCGHQTARVQSRCSKCNHRLHRSILGRVWRAAFGRQLRLSILEAALLVLAILAGLWLIVFLAEFRLPRT
jgi:hypothetical protein